MINFRASSCRIVTASVIAFEENRSKREEPLNPADRRSRSSVMTK